MLKTFILSIIGISLLLSTGCQSSSVQLSQAVLATNISVTTTNDLLINKVINKDQATKVYQAAVTVEAAEKLWDTAITTNSTDQIITDTAQVLQDLVVLQTQLAAIQTKTSAKNVGLAKSTKANVSIVEIENILVTVLELAPDIAAVQTFINTAFSQTTVTQAQLVQDFTDLDNSEAALLVTINTPTTVPTTVTVNSNK